MKAQLAADLARLVSEDALLTAPEDLRAYDQAARYEGGRAAMVVRPRGPAGVAAIVAWCVGHQVELAVQGANTGLVGASTADDSGRQVLLSLERLQAPLEIDPVNRSVRAGAGVRLSAVNAALQPHGLFLPIDLGADPTIGGMAATNTGGARFIRYGDMRRQVLGLEMVLADAAGTVVRLRRGLRKDNTGLDLRQVVIGAGGALGVITAVEFEAHPLPAQTAAALVLLEDLDTALPLLLHMEREGSETLSAFEGMSRAALAAALAHGPGLRNPFAGDLPPYVVLVELSTTRSPRPGETPLGEQLEQSLADWLETDEGGGVIDILTGAPEPLWAIRHAISEGLRAKGRVIGFDLAFRRSDLAAFRRAASARLAADFSEFELCDFGHIGDGGVHFNLVSDPDAPPTAERLSALRQAVYEIACLQFGGSFSGEHGLGRANLAQYQALTPAPVRGLAARVQGAFADRALGAVDYAALECPAHGAD
ncbi:FAD-binding oxidoreductase [Phenylobacterium sp.]|uniref:FAD-binding oxidoreductase n=1 Tax=Phenylobacterium sp. TaxID=1871053 RepID=UPI0026355C5D|nr:FAD-binding oxidoreductase [Phenylobacterium sp.]